MKKLLLFAIITNSFLSSKAQWVTDGIPVGTGSNNQWKPDITAGTIGDAFLTWSDANLGTADYNVHVSRLSAKGVIKWTVVACNATGNQEAPQIIKDGSGGVIVAWHDQRGGAGNYATYSQRIDSLGVIQWAANGIQVSNVISSTDTKPKITPDINGGFFVVFHNQTDVFAQRLNGSGVTQWGASGVNLSAGITSTAQDDPQLTADGAGGIIVAWEDNGNINAQKINSAGTELWGASGVGTVVCNATSTQDIPQIVSDGSGGAIIAWEDDRNGTANTGIYAVRMVATGSASISWTPNGNMVGETGFDCRWRASDTYGHNNYHIVPDGTGNYYVIYDVFDGVDFSIFGRRISGVNGVSLNTFTVNMDKNDETESRAVSDGYGKVIVTYDYQDTVSTAIHHIRSVTIDQAAVKTNNLYICDGNAVGGGDRSLPAVCVSECYAIYGWQDSRGTGTWDVYASSSRTLSAPITATATCAISLDVTNVSKNEDDLYVYPNPAGNLFNLIVAEKTELTILNLIGEKIKTVQLQSGKNEVMVADLPKGIYFLQSGNHIQKLILQ